MRFGKTVRGGEKSEGGFWASVNFLDGRGGCWGCREGVTDGQGFEEGGGEVYRRRGGEGPLRGGLRVSSTGMLCYVVLCAYRSMCFIWASCMGMLPLSLGLMRRGLVEYCQHVSSIRAKAKSPLSTQSTLFITGQKL